MSKAPNPQLLHGAAAKMAAHFSGCVCTWISKMQSTNSVYGTPYLAKHHVSSTFIKKRAKVLL